MSVLKLALTAMTLAATVVRHPLVRAGVRAAIANPKLKDSAVKNTRSAAYNAGRLARKILPPKNIE